MKSLAHFPPPLCCGYLTLSAALTGCASMQSHDKLASDVQSAQASTRGIPAALAQLEASATSPKTQKTALLYNLERASCCAWTAATKTAPTPSCWPTSRSRNGKRPPRPILPSSWGTVGAALVSERLKNYEGQDYEKVWLTTRLAMNRVALGDFENARVDIKRTHEREAVIAEFRSKETLAAEEEAKSKGAAAGGKELNGYPVETLNDPEVLALKNGYQNALSHYLAGFMYEVLGESGLAAPGYRKAIELKPETGVLEEGLRGLDNRTSFTWKRRQRMTDVLFVVEAGDAPARKPKAFTIPVPTGRGMVTASISYPVIEPSNRPAADHAVGRRHRPQAGKSGGRERDGPPCPQGRNARHGAARRDPCRRQRRDAKRVAKAWRSGGWPDWRCRLGCDRGGR